MAGEHNVGDRAPVAELLDEYNFNILKDMVRLLAVEPDEHARPNLAPSTKQEHIEALTPILFTPQAVSKGLSLLGRQEMRVLAAIQRSDGEIAASRLRQQLLRQRKIVPQDRRNLYGHYSGINVFAPEQYRTSFTAIIGRLIASGLVCARGIAQEGYSKRNALGQCRSPRTKIYYDNVQILYIPQQIRHLLPKPSPLGLTALERTFEPQNLVRVDEGSARAFQRDIYLYWSTVRAAPLSLTQQGRLYQKDLKRANEALLVPEELDSKGESQTRTEFQTPRLIFLRRLLTDIGILKQAGQTIQALDRPKFLGQNPNVRVQRTFEHWRDGTFWNEMLSIPGVTILSPEVHTSAAPQRIVLARNRVLAHIRDMFRPLPSLPPCSKPPSVSCISPSVVPLPSFLSGWIPIEQLVDRVRTLDYDFLLPRDFRPERSTFYYYYGYTQWTPYSAYGNEMGWNFTPSFADEAEGWEVVEAGFIRAILLGPLHWMGLVDIGYASIGLTAPAEATERRHPDGLSEAYRLTPIGAWVMGIGDEVDIPEGEGKVVVQPNYEILAMDPISDLALARLDEFADRISAERAMQYTLTRESVYRAQRNKWTSDRIIDTLLKMSDKPLPQNVVRTLQEWQHLHERITIHRKGNLLHAANGRLLDQLMENPEVRSRLVTRPGENVAIVTPEPGAIQELARTLQGLGYPPSQTRDGRDALHPSFTISPEGQLLFREALPSIYLLEQIAPFTGRDERGRYFLTQSAVQEALYAVRPPSSVGERSFVVATSVSLSTTSSGSPLTVNDILSRLQALHIGPLPRWVEIKVRAWGHYYGDAAMQTLTLVQFRDRNTLLELLREPELKGLLQIFTLDKDRALAVVSAEDPASLREALIQRGIEIRDRLE